MNCSEQIFINCENYKLYLRNKWLYKYICYIVILNFSVFYIEIWFG